MENNNRPYRYNNRDLSWLAFNGRVLDEAAREEVPLLERIKFLSIFSSNLDEFYRVRMPVIAALQRIGQQPAGEDTDLLKRAIETITRQQQQFGKTFTGTIIPALREHNVHLYYNEELPGYLHEVCYQHFYNEVMGYLQPVILGAGTNFFPENNALYFLVTSNNAAGGQDLIVLNIPSDKVNRFFETTYNSEHCIVFLDDIVRLCLPSVFPGREINGCYSFKVTRDAELDLKDEYPGDVAEEVETQLNKREQGLATRFLHQPGIPLHTLYAVKALLGLEHALDVEGGRYHNLRDLASFPVSISSLKDKKWPALKWPDLAADETIFDVIDRQDILLNIPYQSYHSILRFFNEAAVRPEVEEIYITLYRVARESKIANALISAAKNGKKVTVMIELKARFDEANNIRWARKMKAAGVRIVYSVTALKVHAKIALVKRSDGLRTKYSGLLATGNFNESTASFYTDHILMTSHPGLTREMELLLMFLAKRQKPQSPQLIPFRELLVSQFNLQQRFIDLIDREIAIAKSGKPASIIIKMNNLEERILINKLYEASNAGVVVQLIVRSICCVVPGVEGMSENISVRRIVDRYLEHGRVFMFNNDGDTQVFMGSSDWMNRNIYRRIEVCFPVYDSKIKTELIQLLDIQLRDNVKAVRVAADMNNVPIGVDGEPVESQLEIYNYLKENKHEQVL